MSECLNQVYAIRERDSMLMQHEFANQYNADDQCINYHSLPLNVAWTPDVLDNIEMVPASNPGVIDSEDEHYEEIQDKIPVKYQNCDWVDEVTQLEWNAATSTPVITNHYNEILDAQIFTSERTASNPISWNSNYEEIPDEDNAELTKDLFTNDSIVSSTHSKFGEGSVDSSMLSLVNKSLVSSALSS